MIDFSSLGVVTLKTGENKRAEDICRFRILSKE
jgi:hypothetical protein